MSNIIKIIYLTLQLTVTISFNRANENNKVGNKVGNKNLNNSQIKVLAEIRNNPNVTK